MKRLFAFLALSAVFCGCSLRHEQHDAVVVDKVYAPASSGSGTVVGANGKVGVVSTSTSEKWVVLLQVGDETVSVETSPKHWGRMSKGQRVRVDFGFGKHTGIRWTESVVSE